MARYIDADKIHYPVDKRATGKNAWEYGILYMNAQIDKTPTADVEEVKHGKWMKKGNEKKCSVCNFIYYSNNDDWNYCPNCGAKMDGKGE